MSLPDWLEIFSQPWAQRALLASVLVGIMCGILGCFIVLRNMALIGDALSHAILPGIVLAFIFFGYSTLGFFLGSVLAGLVAAVWMTWIQQKIQTKNDAAIGIVFTAMFSLGVIGISWISKKQGVHLDLKDFLFGNVLGVSNEDLLLTTGITIYVIVSVVIFYRHLFISTFQPVIAQTMGISTRLMHYFIMLLLSFAVVAALRTVGVILVVAMLITPASAALLLSNRLKMVILIAGLVGVFSATGGLLLAMIYDTTPGPAMALVSTLIYSAASLFAPGKGLASRLVQRKRLNRRIQMEDILKQAFHAQSDQLRKNSKELPSMMDRSKAHESALKQLIKKGFVKLEGNKLQLTTEGNSEASRLVRAHRLWETYLVDQIGLNEEQIHEEAEKYEHLLTDEILDEVDVELGYPTLDPHGSPIPARNGAIKLSLWTLEIGQQAYIATEQPNHLVMADLWRMGLIPESRISILEKQDMSLKVNLDGKVLEIAADLARAIYINQD